MHTNFLKTLFVLVTFMCSSTSIWAFDFANAACIEEEVEAPQRLQAIAPMPMNTRQGDVNIDGAVNINDVTDLIYMLLNDFITNSSSADVNQDGLVNIVDVTDLIYMLLTEETAYNYGKALYDLNEIYTSMRTAGWSTTGNTHQCFGISAYNLMAEVMGDDMIMGSQGSGWFWFDATYNVKLRYTNTTWRSYDLWTAYYTWIANANYILEAMRTTNAQASQANYVKGQAYAIRAYSYFMLAQSFARTYKGHESDPCVPICTATVFNGSTSATRSTVAEVYAQIDSDIAQAITLLNGTTQQIPSHMGYAVALGLKARIALVKEDWSTALNSASAAINASGKTILEVGDFAGLNDATAGNVMWGVQIPADGVGMYASLWAHMSYNQAYGQRSPKEISKWLYNKMSATDSRQAWWTNDYGLAAPLQTKFEVKEGTEWEGDYIWMRVEEMYLTAAEAACRLGSNTTAKNYLNTLMSKRDPNYTCNKTGTALGALTTDETGSLLEEILIQRRIELWGEDGRIYTIRRLRQGFERTTENGWPTGLLLQNHSVKNPESYAWVLTIPTSEFYNYYSRLILAADQNPLGDTYEEPLDVERMPQHLTFTNAEYRFELGPTDTENLTIRVMRSSTSSKPYYALIRLQEYSYISPKWYYVTFEPNQLSCDITIPFDANSYTMGHHDFTLSLTDLEVSAANSSQMTSTRIVFDILNYGAEGQHISFATANQFVTSYDDGYQEVPVTLTRAVNTYEYRAKMSLYYITDTIMFGGYVYATFPAGESTTTLMLAFGSTEFGDTFTRRLVLSDEDIATANPSLGEQITTTTITLEVKNPWEPAGTCTFIDYTWNNGDGDSANSIPVENYIGTNSYRIVDPLRAIYGSSYGTNFEFELNNDGSITVPEGLGTLNYWGYVFYYDSTNYPDYCYIEQNGNTYIVHHLLNNGTQLFTGRFQFTWDR